MLLKNPAFANQRIPWAGLLKPLHFNAQGIVNIPDEKLALALLKNKGWERVPDEKTAPAKKEVIFQPPLFEVKEAKSKIKKGE